MLTGPFLIDDPVPLSIAADYRFGNSHPQIDAVWQLHLKADEPLSLGSTLGLQAQSLRIFPSFILQNQRLALFSSFFSSPRLDLILSNYLRLSFALNPGLAVTFEAWAANSNRLLGRVELVNENSQSAELELDLNADLVPLSGAAGMSPVMHKFHSLLKGETGSLALALGMEGPARPMFSPLPALSWKASVPARSKLALQWRLVVDSDMSAALAGAAEAYPDNFSAEVARMLNRNRMDQVTITEAEPGWMEVFAGSQMLASQLIHPATPEPEAKTQVLPKRNPNTSFPQQSLPLPGLRRQAPLPALLLRQVLLGLPIGQADQAQALFANHLEGLSAQGAGSADLPFPCLAQLAWQLFARRQERPFLEAVYPVLKDLTLAWFDQVNDRDADGLPEWQNLAQTVLNHQQGLDLMDPANQAADITKTENSALAALLLEELSAVDAMAQYLNDQTTVQIVRGLSERSRLALEHQRDGGVFGMWDRDSHQRSKGELLYRGPAQSVNGPIYNLRIPQRLHLQIIPGGIPRKPLSITLTGQDAAGKPQQEALGAGQISWLPGFFFASTQLIYRQIESLVIEGDNAELLLYTPGTDGYRIADLYDWSDVLATQPWVTASLEALAGETPYGLPELLMPGTGFTGNNSNNQLWTSLLISRLTQIGERQLAFRLLQAWVSAAVRTLKTEHAFFEAADVKTGRPQGNRSAAAGIIPIELLLQLAGVQFLSGERVQIGGENPFPWPIGLRYRGISVKRDGKNTRITFPNGELQHHFGSVKRIFQAKSNLEKPESSPESGQ